MKGLSKRQIEVISDLEFRKRYYFTCEDIEKYFKNRRQIVDFIYRLHKKERIVSLNKNKYYLIPIKARSGKWSDYPFIICDEIFNGKDYFIGGWSAANYWKLTDQIPMKIEVYTTKRQGKITVLNTSFLFRRTTQKRIETDAVTQKMGEHEFRVLSKEKATEWIKSRN